MRWSNRYPITNSEVQDLLVRGELTVKGQTTQVDDIVTTDIVVNDSNGNKQFVFDGDASVPTADFLGNSITGLGGSPDASSGAIRLANDSWIAARNSEDSADVNVVKANASENVEVGTSIEMNSNSLLREGTNFEIDFSGGRISFNGGLDILSNGRFRNDNYLEFGTSQEYRTGWNNNQGYWVFQNFESGNNKYDIIRQAHDEPTQFLQGIDAGTIEAPEDSFTQLVNADVTSSPASGEVVGYTLALDNNKSISIEAEADGSGGIQKEQVLINDNGNATVPDVGSIADDTSGLNLSNGQVDLLVEGSPVANFGLFTRNAVRINTSIEANNSGVVFATGTVQRSRRDISSNTTVDDGIHYSVDSSGGSVTITLSDAAAKDGREVNIKRNGANTVTIDTQSSQTIDDSSTYDLTSDNESVKLVYNSTNSDWEVF